MKIFLLAALFSISSATLATHVRIIARKPIVLRRPTKFKRWSDVDLYASVPSAPLDSYGLPISNPEISYGGFRPLTSAPAAAPAVDAASPWASLLPSDGNFNALAAKEPIAAPTQAPLPETTTAAPTPAPTEVTTAAAALPTGPPLSVSKISETITIGLPHPLNLGHLGLDPAQIDHSASQYLRQLGIYQAPVLSQK